MNVKIMGADQSLTNISGNNFLDILQVTTKRSRLYKITFSPLAGMAAAVYGWVFDLAAGTTASAAPVAVIPAATAAGVVWDFGPDGALFNNGIFIELSTVRPTDATTAVTASGNNKMIVKIDYRVG